jgi:hypothetical protein
MGEHPIGMGWTVNEAAVERWVAWDAGGGWAVFNRLGLVGGAWKAPFLGGEGTDVG